MLQYLCKKKPKFPISKYKNTQTSGFAPSINFRTSFLLSAQAFDSCVAGGEQREDGKSRAEVQIWSKYRRPDKCFKAGSKSQSCILVYSHSTPAGLSWANNYLMTQMLLQDGVGVSHSQVPPKPVRRKYHPESQSVEAAAPPGTSFPTKAAQKLVTHCF